jgi:ribosomal protein S18 acetylase RimI-like enzyme
MVAGKFAGGSIKCMLKGVRKMTHIYIREALPDDAEAIRNVQYRTWLATYPNEVYGITKEDIEARFREDSDPEKARERRKRYRQSLCVPPFRVWVALEGTALIGFCRAKQDDLESCVQALYVLPEFQHKGIGKRLLQTALDWLGVEKEVVLEVAAYNEKAIAFYRAFGFILAGSIPVSESLQMPSGVRFPEIKMVKKGRAN